MKFIIFPTRNELERHAKEIPEIDPSAVLAMLRIGQAQEEIRASISDVLERQYNLSEGKLRVMIVLHQSPQGIAPSVLAAKTGVTRATISVMIRRMVRNGEAVSVSDDKDKRGKKITLTPQGRKFMDRILPAHYARISKKMGTLTEAEQQELIRLLEKLGNS